jgi:hypothetical protein
LAQRLPGGPEADAILGRRTLRVRRRRALATGTIPAPQGAETAMEPTPPPSRDTVTAHLECELAGLEALLEELSWAGEAGRLEHARQLQCRFARALERHVRNEEDLLLPVFEARTGVSGPAATMRAEHREAERGVAMMGAGLAAGDVESFRDGVAFLRAILPGHHSREHILLPAVDLLLTEAERGRLLERLVP